MGTSYESSSRFVWHDIYFTINVHLCVFSFFIYFITFSKYLRGAANTNITWLMIKMPKDMLNFIYLVNITIHIVLNSLIMADA